MSRVDQCGGPTVVVLSCGPNIAQMDFEPGKADAGDRRRRFCETKVDYFAIQAGERISKYAGFSFDASIFEVFPTCIAGATLVRSTRIGQPNVPAFVKEWISWGIGPRGGQSLIAAAQARAALDGRPEVDIGDIQAIAKAVLRHRIVLNYNAEAQGQTAETVIQKLIDAIPLDAAAERQLRSP